MVCVQDRDGNVVRGSNGKADQRYCNFGGGGAAAPLIHLGPLALDTTQIGILLVVVVLVVALLFFSGLLSLKPNPGKQPTLHHGKGDGYHDTSGHQARIGARFVVYVHLQNLDVLQDSQGAARGMLRLWLDRPLRHDVPRGGIIPIISLPRGAPGAPPPRLMTEGVIG